MRPQVAREPVRPPQRLVIVGNIELDRYPITGRFLAGRCRDGLGDSARAAIENLFAAPESVADGALLTEAFAPVDAVSILVDGFVLRVIADDTGRTIVGIQMPGDLIDLPALGLGYLDHDLIALGPVTLAQTGQAQLTDLALANGEVGRALWVASQLDGTIQRQWAVKLGRLKASRRAARVLAELWCRLELIGLAHTTGYYIPLTQQHLADMCGTTAIHMNRALGELRRLELADVRRGFVTAADRAALEDYGQFRHDYLTARKIAHANVSDMGISHITM